jgi:hypothetical protein
MKKCTYCGRENDEAAEFCPGCGQQEFESPPAASVPARVQAQAPRQQPLPPKPLASKEGNSMLLRCRTPAEAFLIVKELEAEDIITVLPQTQTLIQDYERDGHVTIKVSARAYESAKELQYIFENRHWQERGEMSLPLSMAALALVLPVVIGLGWFCFAMVWLNYKRRGFVRKKKAFELWFWGGVLFWLTLLIVKFN